jgi:hypothetical protein
MLVLKILVAVVQLEKPSSTVLWSGTEALLVNCSLETDLSVIVNFNLQ